MLPHYRGFVAHLGEATQGQALGVIKHRQCIRNPRVVAWEIFQVTTYRERDDVAVVRVRARHFGLQVDDVRAAFRDNHVRQSSRRAGVRIGQYRYRWRAGKRRAAKVNDLNPLGMEIGLPGPTGIQLFRTPHSRKMVKVPPQPW